MNTPDTEKKCCEKCECHAGIPPAKRMSQLHGTPFCGYTNCPCHTPDTELKKHAQRADYFEPDTLVMTLDNIDLLLTSRDTYWKERVRDVKFDIEALRGSPRDTDIEYARAITDVHKILDTLLENLTKGE